MIPQVREVFDVSGSLSVVISKLKNQASFQSQNGKYDIQNVTSCFDF